MQNFCFLYLSTDPKLSRYSALIIDEAHERSMNTDLILGLLRGLIEQRKDLRIIITSATLEAEKFSSFFKSAPVLDIPGRVFPVEVLEVFYLVIAF